MPNIAEKLEPEKTRDLKNGKEFWEAKLNQSHEVTCIYSHQPLVKSISIDHFLPWSFVGHDLLWNLLPTTKSVNSKKSDCLPDLNLYLMPFLKLQFETFHLNYQLGNKKKLLEDYCILFAKELDDISRLSEDEFHNKLKDNILPMHQIAQNMGFIPNWKYTL